MANRHQSKMLIYQIQLYLKPSPQQMQQMILQTAIPYQPSLPRLFKSNLGQKLNCDELPRNQEPSSLKTSNKFDDDSIAITPFDHRETMMTRNSTNQNKDDDGEEQWPQIQSIIKKIRSLQVKLKDSRRINQTLNLKMAEYETKLLAFEQLKTQGLQRLAEQQENKVALDNRIKQLEQQLSQKENLLVEKQHLIEEIQFTQVKKNRDYDEKIKKMNTQSKQLMDKLRKANIQLQKQRKVYKQLKQSMTSQVQQMQSKRQEELIDEIRKLKQFISNSKQQKEILLYQQIDKLSRQLYLKQQEIRRKNIEINLCDRKKHQAVNDVVEKKDAELKVQKLLFKSLNQKMLKLQEQIKSNKATQINQASKSHHRFQRATTDREEQISFNLSPDKQ